MKRNLSLLGLLSVEIYKTIFKPDMKPMTHFNEYYLLKTKEQG